MGSSTSKNECYHEQIIDCYDIVKQIHGLRYDLEPIIQTSYYSKNASVIGWNVNKEGKIYPLDIDGFLS